MSDSVTGRRPTAAEIAAARVLLEPWRLLTSPRFYGVQQVPTNRPFLLVGNHTLMGVLDVPLMLLGLYERWLRSGTARDTHRLVALGVIPTKPEPGKSH